MAPSPFGYDMNDLYREAQHRWLKPAEVHYILQNHENYQLSHEPPQLPSSGSLFLFNKRVLRFFRRDGHNWRKKRDQRTVGEAHEHLKVGNVETLNCYYAHGAQNPHFQRRSYWILETAFEHIVLVHYRDISEGKSSPGPRSIASSSLLSSSPSQSPHSSQNQGSSSIMSGLNGSYQNLVSPEPAEVSSKVVYNNNESDHLQRIHGGEIFSLKEGLRRLEEQLSLNDDTINELEPLVIEDEYFNSAGYSDYGGGMANENQQQNFVDGPEYSASYQLPPEHNAVQDHLSNYLVFQDTDENRTAVGNHDSLLSEMLEPWSKPLSSNGSGLQEKEGYQWSNTTPIDQVEHIEIPAYPSAAEVDTGAYYQMLLDQSMPPESPAQSLTVSQIQRYTIQEISPPWGYSTEATKVIIVGSFLCDPSEFSWKCMFGDVEVPIAIIKEGVLRCEAPPCLPAKVTIYITTGNRQSCSEVREFEYRAKSDICTQCKSAPLEAPETTEELLHLVRFVQMLLHDSAEKDTNLSGTHLLKTTTADSDSCNHIIEALLDGTGSSTQTYSLLLNALLKDKLNQWFSVRSSLSRKEQGIIHMVASLGVEWALNPILSCGVSVNFRDISGWTALHWAARFGREKMVAALIASGAFAGAVTDPSAKDPTGKTAASIAATSGHKGLAGYLSEVSLTSHLSSLTLEESELSKGSAEFEAEITVNSIAGGGEDQLSLTDTLAAVRNAQLAAARIQLAFRAHSFRKRQHRDVDGGVGDYGMSPDDIHAMSRLALRSGRDCNSAALSIQKKYRGWRGRREFLAIRQKVVKIQAHVRGYQVRKHYKVVWAVGVLEKVILRWRRKGVGLRNFRNGTESSINESEDEDILKVFRKQKVDGAIDEAVSRVLSMVDSPVAQQQYRRMLESYRQAKAQIDSTSSDFTNMMMTLGDFPHVENGGYMYTLP